MTARKTRPTAAPVRAPVDWSGPAESGRQQIAVATESADAMLRGFATIRKINDRAVQGALVRYAAAAEKLKAPFEPMDLLAIQSDLMRSQIEGATSYWQELSGAAMEMQAELLGCSSHLVDSDAVLQAAHAVDSLPAFPTFPSFPDLDRFNRFFGAAVPTRSASGRG